MTDLHPLSQARHGALGWRAEAPPVVVGHDTRALPVGTDEMLRLASRMPIVLGIAGQTPEPLIPVGALDRRPGALVDAAGYWQPAVLPMALRQGPFRVVPSPEGEIVMVDETDLRPVDPHAASIRPLFEGQGEIGAATRARITELAAWMRGRAAARTAAAALDAAGCLAEITLGRLTVRIADEARLAEQRGPALARLHEVGALRLAHLSAVSLGTLVAQATRPRQTGNPAGTAETAAFLAAMREAMG